MIILQKGLKENEREWNQLNSSMFIPPIISENLEVPIVGALSKNKCRWESCLEDRSSQSNWAHDLEKGTAIRLHGLTYDGEGNLTTNAHSSPWDGACARSSEDGAFCMEVRITIKQAEIPKWQHFGFVCRAPSSSCSSCSISAAFLNTILVYSPLSRKCRYVTRTLF